MTQYVYCDGSFSPQSKIGVGAVLYLSAEEWGSWSEKVGSTILTKVTPSTSIARIELMTAIWALSVPDLPKGIQLFTDCKTIEDLPQRRSKLEGNAFKSRRTGLPLSNADLYEQFFERVDAVQPIITWIKGHAPASERSQHQRVFRSVDKKARAVLREQIKKST